MTFVIVGLHRHTNNRYRYSKGILKPNVPGTLFLRQETAQKASLELLSILENAEDWKISVKPRAMEEHAVLM
jgi:hypothetical protein